MGARPVGDVLAEHGETLLGIAGVVGAALGQSEGRDCILVFVDRADADSVTVPSSLEGYPVVVQETGEIVAQ